MLLPLAMMMSLGATPLEAPCEGERMVMLPFGKVAVARSEARQTEEAVRRAVASAPGVCLESRQQTVERLRALGGPLEPCAEERCQEGQLKALEARWLVRGRVLGLGGERTVALELVGPEGQEARSTFLAPDGEAGAEDAAARAFSGLWEALRRQRTAEPRTLSPWPQVLIGVGAAALVAGVGFGMAARSTEQRLSEGAGGCEGEGEPFRRCFADGLRRGRQQSFLSNALLGTGAVLGAGGAILFVWELP